MLLDDDVLVINADGPERLFGAGRDSGVASPCWPAAPLGECCALVIGLEKLQPMVTSS